MKIAKVETIVIQLPGRMDYSWRSLQVPIGRFVILKLTTDEGIVGLGEAPAILSWGGEHGRYFGEDPEIVTYLVNEKLSSFIIGADPRTIRSLMIEMDLNIRGYPYAKAMIECAMLDILGHKLGVPVYQLLGGAMRSEVPVCHSIGIAPPDDAARLASEVVSDGINWLQIKVPGDPKQDLEIIKAIRKEVGDNINIFPDINRGYYDAKSAINSIKAMYNEANICGIEQPVEGIEAMSAITRAVEVPVIVDEGCWSPQDASEVVKRNSADIISIYYTKASGLYRSTQIGSIAHAAALSVNVNGSLESGVGNAANLHLSVALEGNVLPGVITVNTLKGREQTRVGGVFYTDDIISDPFLYQNGCLKVPSNPGLGIELDPEKIARYREN